MQRPSPQHLKRKNSRHTTRRKRGKGAGGHTNWDKRLLSTFVHQEIPSSQTLRSILNSFKERWIIRVRDCRIRHRWDVSTLDCAGVGRAFVDGRSSGSNDASKSSPKVGQIPFPRQVAPIGDVFGLSPANSSSSSCSAPNSAGATPAPTDGNCTATVSHLETVDYPSWSGAIVLLIPVMAITSCLCPTQSKSSSFDIVPLYHRSPIRFGRVPHNLSIRWLREYILHYERPVYNPI